MTPGIMPGGAPGSGIPIATNYRNPPEAVDVIADRVGPGTDEATRERAVRVALVGLGFFSGSYRRELIPEMGITERWLAATPGSPEREREAARAKWIAGLDESKTPYHRLAVVLVHAEPGRCAGAAVAHAAREGQAMAGFFVPSLIRALDAAGFKPVGA